MEQNNIRNTHEIVLSGFKDLGRQIIVQWFYPMVVNTLLILFQTDMSEEYRIIVIKDVRVQNQVPCLNPNSIQGTHIYIYGLETVTYLPYKFYRLSGYVLVKNNNSDSVDSGFRVTLSNQSECVLLGKKFIRGIQSLSIGLEHSPPSTYAISMSPIQNFINCKIIFLQEENKEIYLFTDTHIQCRFVIPFQLNATHTYRLRVITGRSHAENESDGDVLRIGDVGFSNLIDFKAYFTKQEYSTLYQMSLKFKRKRNRGIYPITYLYRSKPFYHFQNIFRRDKGLMLPYKKDFNGDPCSVINGNINGLFFSTSIDLQTNHPPMESYFGETRLNVNALQLFNHNCNLYFVDFYCHYHAHYVTVLLTPRDSQTDRFCRDRLLSLDIFNNPFMFLHYTGEQWIVCADHDVHVEVFYTESIDIPNIISNDLGFINKVTPLGRGSSRLLGIPKNKECVVCNIVKG